MLDGIITPTGKFILNRSLKRQIERRKERSTIYKPTNKGKESDNTKAFSKILEKPPQTCD